MGYLIFFIYKFLSLSSSLAYEKGPLWKDSVLSIYTEPVAQIFDQWKKGSRSIKKIGKEGEMAFGPLHTKDDKLYIGMWAKVDINADLDAIVKILKKIPNYPAIYIDLKKIEIVKEQKNESQIAWSFSGPMGTQTDYETVQTVEKFNSSRGGLIYGFRKSDKVTAADGLILLNTKDKITNYVSIDFFNADWGSIGKLFSNQIWKDTCRSTAKSTFIIKTMAEKSIEKVELTRSSGYDDEKVTQICSEMRGRGVQKEFEKQILEILD